MVFSRFTLYDGSMTQTPKPRLSDAVLGMLTPIIETEAEVLWRWAEALCYFANVAEAAGKEAMAARYRARASVLVARA